MKQSIKIKQYELKAEMQPTQPQAKTISVIFRKLKIICVEI
jgi:hypothetical protein